MKWIITQYLLTVGCFGAFALVAKRFGIVLP
jgi:hypothetical protein